MSELRQQIEKARKAQQENEQKHDVQLELTEEEHDEWCWIACPHKTPPKQNTRQGN